MKLYEIKYNIPPKGGCCGRRRGNPSPRIVLIRAETPELARIEVRKMTRRGKIEYIRELPEK
jgi:hypothetical protein